MSFTDQPTWRVAGHRLPANWPVAKVFGVVMVICLIASLSYTFMRAPVYRSTATLLIAPPSAFQDDVTASDIQYVAVQSQLLTSRGLLQSTWDRLQNSAFSSAFPDISMLEIESMMRVEPLPESILRMHVEDTEQMALEPIAAAWLETYQQFQGTGIDDEQTETLSSLSEENAQLLEHLDEKRRELEAYASEHSITSTVREENEALSQLSGLSSSLAEATGEVVRAEARLQALREAGESGQYAATQEVARELASMQSAAAKLKGKLDKLRQRYTPAYMEKDPAIVAMQEEFQLLQAGIVELREESHGDAMREAQRALAEARALKSGLQRQLDESDANIRSFSEHFTRYEEMLRELERLEELAHVSGERLVSETVGSRNRAPRITVLDWPQVPGESIYPRYTRDAIISLGGSLLAALLASWLYMSALRNQVWMSSVEESSVVLQAWREREPALAARQPEALMAAEAVHQLPVGSRGEQSDLKMLAAAEVAALCQSAMPATRLMIELLMSGVRPDELPGLAPGALDAGQLQIGGRHRRTIGLSDSTLQLWGEVVGNSAEPLIWSDGLGKELPEHELEALLQCAVIDAGVEQPRTVNLHSVHMTYLVFLAQQGLRLGEFGAIAGTLDRDILEFLAQFSPAGESLSRQQIDLHYPWELVLSTPGEEEVT